MQPEVKVVFLRLTTTTQEMYAYAYDNGKEEKEFEDCNQQ